MALTSRPRTARSRLQTSLSASVSAVLCLCLGAAPQSWAAPAHRRAPKKPGTASKPALLPAEQRTLQALRRFTFGPRPGDVQAVNDMGLEAWFNRQLHPDRIPDTALEARLASFPAMQLSEAELLRRFPSPGMLRQYSSGRLGAPSDPVERAVYADASFNYAEKRANKLAKTKAAAGSPGVPRAVHRSTTAM